MSIEKIRYAVVTTSTVKNPVPELIPKYQESLKTQSSTSSSAAKTTSSDLKAAEAEARSVLKGLNDDSASGNATAVRRESLINLNRTAQASGQAEFNNLGKEGRKAAIQQYGSEYNAVKAFGEKKFKVLAEGAGYKDATFDPR